MEMFLFSAFMFSFLPICKFASFPLLSLDSIMCSIQTALNLVRQIDGCLRQLAEKLSYSLEGFCAH